MDKATAILPPWVGHGDVSCAVFQGECAPTDSERIRHDLAARIRRWRHECDWSLEAAAQKLGVSPSTIHLWENGKRFPNLENLIALAMLIGEKPCQLMCPGHVCGE